MACSYFLKDPAVGAQIYLILALYDPSIRLVLQWCKPLSSQIDAENGTILGANIYKPPLACGV
jgi:hypothetical protein